MWSECYVLQHSPSMANRVLNVFYNLQSNRCNVLTGYCLCNTGTTAGLQTPGDINNKNPIRPSTYTCTKCI